MDAMRICSGCQKPLPADGPDGLCPECLMKAGLGSEVDIGLDSAGGSGRTPFAAPAPEDVARLFSQLEILGFIGQGGMDAVYKARQKALDRVVALKILPPGIGKEPAFAERFTREAKALAKLNHTGIVTLYEFGQADGQFFFLMEFVDGVNLRDLLEAGRVSPREALAIVPQLCDALQYAHDQGIVHRDIKPENILLDRQGRVKVADFGLAKLVGPEALIPALSHPTGGGASAPGEGTPPSAALTDVGKVMGTPQYMAPEQREHPTEMDHRADIYSLGVVFYQMLTVELPGKPIEPPSRKVQIDVRLDEVVLRALEKKPALRYQQVSEVKTCVETILGSAGGPPAEPGAALGATVNKSGFVRLFETFSVRAFTSPLAIKLINVSALGFLGALAFLRFVALPGMEYCIGFAGFFFFFGLIGLAFMAEMANRRKAKQTTGSLPLFVEHAGRRRLYWPGVLLFCGTLGLVVFGVNLAIALALWLLNAPVRLTFQPGELLLVCILMAACVIMRLAALKLGSSEVARAGSAPATKVSAARKVLLAFLAVAVAFAVAAGLGIGIMVLAWMWTSAKTPPSAAALISAASPLSRPVTTESPNSVLEVRNGGPRTSIRAELDDAHELRVFIGGEALGWSVRPAGATSVIATVEVSSGLRFPDGNNWGRELIFEAWRVRHTNSVNTGSPNRHYRGVGLRQNGRIVNDKGTFTFADIRQTNGTLIPVSIRVRPVPVNAVGDNSAPEAAKLKLDQTQAEFARIRELYDGKLVSQSDYEAAQLAKDLAVAELKGDAVEVARLRLQSAQTNLARMKELYERKLVSESDYAAAQLVKDVAEEKLTRETDAAKDPTKVPSNQPTQSTPAGA